MALSSLIRLNSRHFHAPGRRHASSSSSPHGQFYNDLLPAMVPVALLGSAVYLGLQMLRGSLAQEKYLDETTARVHILEREIEELRAQQAKRDESGSSAPDGVILKEKGLTSWKYEDSKSRKYWFKW